MEAIVERMQSETGGVAVRTVKAFMSKIPSVFSGADLISWVEFNAIARGKKLELSFISWILKNLDVEDTAEALHLAHLLASHGYLFPIVSHCDKISSTRE